MASFREVLVIEDDIAITIDGDDHGPDRDGDEDILDLCKPTVPIPKRRRTSRTLDDDFQSKSCVGSSSRTEPLSTRASGPSQPRQNTSRINSTFQSPNWGFKAMKSMSASQKNVTSFHKNRSESMGNPLFSACPSPNSKPRAFDGSAQRPIQLDDHDVVMGPETGIRELHSLRHPPHIEDQDDVTLIETKQRSSVQRPSHLENGDVVMDTSERRSPKIQLGNWRSNSSSISSSSLSRCQSDHIILDDEDLTRPFSLQDQLPSFQPSLEQSRKSTKQVVLIDLESLEDVAGEGLEMLRIEHVYEEEIEAQKRRRKKSTIQYERRNPSIVGPWERIANIACGKDITLKANKTVELKDQSFIRIKDILRNKQTQEIRLRGHRLQRARELNGLLEKKLNELVLFLEVDQDDPRLPTEQSTVEVNLEEFEKIRSVRFTNQKFPLARNCQPEEFRNKDHAAAEGGLTVRWKYTCTYTSAADRHHNLYKERTMERLSADECTPGFEISDEDRRTQWRGETVLGGAYRPMLEPDDVIVVPDSPEMNPINLDRRQKPDATSISVLTKDVVILDDEEINFQVNKTVARRKEKRQHSVVSSGSSSVILAEIPRNKRVRQQDNDGVEKTRKRVSRIELQSSAERNRTLIDQLSKPTHHHPQMIDLSTDLPPVIDLVSSDISKQIPKEAPRSTLQHVKPSLTRLAGQTYTYGDAFCGGGGSSRGAIMAGLHLNWGFDFNKHACLSWRSNFPSSACHQMAAHEFVDQAQRAASSGQPDKMKVDILHLSPPCQFFSPAHTVDGVDDEINVASLFAVQMVIEVSKPRIVTLEQTFGIACPRFRFYFNALIQMFTTHDFSVRWAIVPLAQWGLPQRRTRLIVIASCPGEPLPKMPLPTHSTTGSGPPLNLIPHVSANTTLKSIPRVAADHDIESVTWAPDRYMPPWDGSKILPRAMTTSGGQNYHPSGMRDLTLREYACLQGFPTGHLFRGNYVKKQIGNAVPPVVAKVLFGSIKADLEKVDGVEGPELIE